MAKCKQFKQPSCHTARHLGGRIIVLLVSSLTGLDWVVSVHTNKKFFWSNPILLNWRPDTHTVALSIEVNILFALWCACLDMLSNEVLWSRMLWRYIGRSICIVCNTCIMINMPDIDGIDVLDGRRRRYLNRLLICIMENLMSSLERFFTTKVV